MDELKKKAANLALNDINKSRKTVLIWEWVLLVFDIITSFGLLLNSESNGAKIAISVIDIFCIGMVIVLYQRAKAYTEIKFNLENDQFDLIPCLILEVDMNANLTYGNEVKLVDRDGQLLVDRIVADFEMVDAWKNDYDLECCLLECIYNGQKKYQQLYSKYKLMSN